MLWKLTEEAIVALFTWQIILGGSLALILACLFKRGSKIDPASRYHVWASAFFTVAILPLLALLPFREASLDTGVEPSQAGVVQVESIMSTAPTSHEPLPLVPSDAQLAFYQASLSSPEQPLEVESHQGQIGDVPTLFTIAAEYPLTFSWRQEGLLLLLGLWALVSIYFLAKLVHGLRHLSQLKREADPLEGPLATWFNNTLEQLNLSRKPNLMSHETIGSPMVAGLLKPVVLVPSTLSSELNQEELQQILLHELGHIMRKDDWIHLAQKAFLAIFWYNPGLHWLAKQMAWDRESACDHWAVGLTGKSKQYAYSLLRVSESMLSSPSSLLTVSAVHGKKQLSHRIESLISSDMKTTKLGRTWKLGVLVLLSACVATMALAGPKLMSLPALSQQSDEEREEIERLKAEEFMKAALEKERAALKEAKKDLEERHRILNLKARKLQETSLQMEDLEQQIAAQKRVLESQKSTLDDADEHARRDLELAQRDLEEMLEKKETLVNEIAEVSQNQKTLLVESAYLRKLQAEELEAARHELGLSRTVLVEEQQALSELKRREIEAIHRARQREFEATAHNQEAVLMEQDSMARALAQSRAESERAIAEAESREMHELSGRIRSYQKDFSDRSNNSTTKIQLDDLELTIKGGITFSEDETRIEKIKPGGHFKLDDYRDSNHRHSLTVEPNDDGTLVYNYRYNRNAKSFDSFAEAWLAETLPALLIRSGVNTDARVKRILSKDGVDGVLDLVLKTESDFAIEGHILSLLENATLTEKHIQRVAKSLGSMHSDFHKARLLIALAEKQPNTKKLIETLTEGTKGLTSDFEKRRVLTALIPLADTPSSMATLFNLVGSMSSDFEKSAILRDVIKKWQYSDLAASGFESVLGQISSDFEYSSVVAALSKDQTLTQAQASSIALAASKQIHSDFELARVFNHLGEVLPINSTFRDAFSSLNSDHTRAQVLNQLLENRQLGQKELLIVLECAKSIHSDHSLAGFLKNFRQHAQLEGAVAKHFQEMVRSMGSSHYRDQLTDH